MFESQKNIITLIREAIYLHFNPQSKSKSYQHKLFGTGEFKIIQSINTYGKTTGYISLIIHEKEVVAQKLVCDDDIYDELFNYCVAKLGGRLPEDDGTD
jgi:hypothetical protein